MDISSNLIILFYGLNDTRHRESTKLPGPSKSSSLDKLLFHFVVVVGTMSFQKGFVCIEKPFQGQA